MARTTASNINHAINASPSTALGGLSPFTVFTGRQPSSPLDVVFDRIKHNISTVIPTAAVIQTHTSKLSKTLHELHQKVAAHKPRKKQPRSGETPVDFDVGDYVLTTQPRTIRDKTIPTWTGPVLVIGTVNERVYKVQDIMTGRIQEKHADQLKRFADKDLTVTTQLRNFIAHQACETPSLDIEDIGASGNFSSPGKVLKMKKQHGRMPQHSMRIFPTW